jgi:LmbE family N-acetylglucosaminyl deacetylase
MFTDSEENQVAESIRVLALHAHPDDVEFQCAGTLALLKEAGCAMTIATMTPGDCGSAEHGPDEIAQIRRAEAQESAALIGADYLCLEFRDLEVLNDEASRRRVTEAIRRARPALVITAPPIDYMCDHEQTSSLVRDACFGAPIPNYATRQWDPALPLDRIPHLYFVDPIGGVDRDGHPVPADFHIDISRVFDTKKRMLACHASQRNWLLRQHGIDEYLRIQAEWSAKRGAEIGVAYAEGFRQYAGHPYPQDNLLLRLLGQDGKGKPANAQSAQPTAGRAQGQK